jgi:hypothetical protein
MPFVQPKQAALRTIPRLLAGVILLALVAPVVDGAHGGAAISTWREVGVILGAHGGDAWVDSGNTAHLAYVGLDGMLYYGKQEGLSGEVSGAALDDRTNYKRTAITGASSSKVAVAAVSDGDTATTDILWVHYTEDGGKSWRALRVQENVDGLACGAGPGTYGLGWLDIIAGGGRPGEDTYWVTHTFAQCPNNNLAYSTSGYRFDAGADDALMLSVSSNGQIHGFAPFTGAFLANGLGVLVPGQVAARPCSGPVPTPGCSAPTQTMLFGPIEDRVLRYGNSRVHGAVNDVRRESQEDALFYVEHNASATTRYTAYHTNLRTAPYTTREIALTGTCGNIAQGPANAGPVPLLLDRNGGRVHYFCARGPNEFYHGIFTTDLNSTGAGTSFGYHVPAGGGDALLKANDGEGFVWSNEGRFEQDYFFSAEFTPRGGIYATAAMNGVIHLFLLPDACECGSQGGGGLAGVPSQFSVGSVQVDSRLLLLAVVLGAVGGGLYYASTREAGPSALRHRQVAGVILAAAIGVAILSFALEVLP